MTSSGFDLAASARAEMLAEGFTPDFPAGITAEIAAIRNLNPSDLAGPDVRDLRNLLWSSIDNATSRDLDQIEFADRTPAGIRLLIGIADVSAAVQIGSLVDAHAASEITTVYTPVRVFPMLPSELSTDLTSLGENVDRPAVVIEMLVAPDGVIHSNSIYRALVRNRAQLTYEAIGPWLDSLPSPAQGMLPAKIAASPDLQTQLQLQNEAAEALRSQRHRLGALVFDRMEVQPVVQDGQVTDISSRKKNSASQLIEDFMIAANQVMAQTLRNSGVSAIQRVVKSPERWPRIVEVAARYGAALPAQPDSGALAAFLNQQRTKDEQHFPDLSLAIIKLLGPGEYALVRPGDTNGGHFSLAAHDYTHSTAPNRRFADLVTQRLIRSALSGESAQYSDSGLSAIASRCTEREDKARKVERNMNKRMAAVAFANRVGQTFDAIVTGVTPKGVFVRVLNPPVEGRLMRGEHGVDVGDSIRVTLLSTDPQRGFIDFGR